MKRLVILFLLVLAIGVYGHAVHKTVHKSFSETYNLEIDSVSSLGMIADSFDVKLGNVENYLSFVSRLTVEAPVNFSTETLLRDSIKIVYYTRSNYDGQTKLLDSTSSPTFPFTTAFKYISANDTTLYDELWAKVYIRDSIADTTHLTPGYLEFRGEFNIFFRE